MRETILQLATQAKQKIAVAESCTGGMLAAALTDLPGSSATFERGFVTYSNTAKTELLGVSADTLARHGAVSEPVEKKWRAVRLNAQMAISRFRLPASPDRAAATTNPKGGSALGWPFLAAL